MTLHLYSKEYKISPQLDFVGYCSVCVCVGVYVISRSYSKITAQVNINRNEIKQPMVFKSCFSQILLQNSGLYKSRGCSEYMALFFFLIEWELIQHSLIKSFYYKIKSLKWEGPQGWPRM